MVDFFNEMEKINNLTTTENGAISNKSTLNACVDFFGMGATLENRKNPYNALQLFIKAFNENPEIAMKLFFYIRDVREGQGERHIGRTILGWLSKNYPKIVLKNLDNIPFYGRWDDIYAIIDNCDDKSLLYLNLKDMLIKQLKDDLTNEYPSLLGKWLKSENTSSYGSKRLAKKTYHMLDLSPKTYRKMLTELRKKIGVIETLISQNKWDELDYAKVPSQAMLKYMNAFYTKDGDRFKQYLEKVKNGEEKINSNTNYPYEIVRNMMDSDCYGNLFRYDAGLEEMWKALPDYIENKEDTPLVVCDTSGSMYGLPLTVAISTGLYTAERLDGVYKNKIVTFSNDPQLHHIKGDNLYQKLNSIVAADWDMGTNLEAVFDLVLQTKINNPESIMPNKIIIISDMQFNQAVGYDYTTHHNKMKEKFIEHGLEMPQVVYWNVASNISPITINDAGTALISGCSPVILKQVLAKNLNPTSIMLDVVNQERYNRVKY